VYSITAINSIGCSNTTTLAINVNSTVPSVSTSVSQNPICYGASAALSASGAATYSWSNGVSNGQLFTPSTTATYTLIAGNGCGTVSALQSLSVSPLQMTLAVSSPSVCEGSTCALSAGSSVNGYTWMPGAQTGSTIVVGPLNNPIYTVSASNGTCVGSGTILVNTVASPTIVTSNTLLTLCSGLSGSVSVSGAGTNGTYTWMPGNLSGTAVVLSPSITTGYTVSGTNGAGCSASILLPVVVYPSPTIAIAASKTIACIGESVTLLGSGAATYTWNTGANTGSFVVTSNTANNTYTLSGTAGNTTCTSTQSIALAVVNPSVNYSATQAICNGQSATLTASGATTYTWNGIPTGSTGITVVYPVNTSTYALVANTQSGSANCFNFYTATVQVNALPNLLVAMSKTTNICKGESNTLTVSGAANYTWMPGNTVGSVAIVSPTANTTYTVTGTNSLSCSASSLALVKVDPCTDISSMFVESQWQVHPNPFKDILNIETSIACDVYLYDMGGRLVDHYALKPGINQILTHDLSSGVYSLKAFGEGGVWVSKVVK
jgi:hypothetical protein